MTSIIRPYMLANMPLPFGQLDLEIHVWHKEFSEFLAWWEMLEAAGLRPFMTEVSPSRCRRPLSLRRREFLLQSNLVYQNYNKESNQDLAEVSPSLVFTSIELSNPTFSTHS